MKSIKIKTPAKINLTLEIINKREDGFHNLQSIMHTVGLFDYLTIESQNSAQNLISISGNSSEIPYDERNIAYKAAELFLKKVGLENQKINIFIDKNIPVSAGLAGGSSNAAGVLYGLNKLFDIPLSSAQMGELAAQLGSDVNFCLFGGAKLASSRGEVLEKVTAADFDLIIIKPDKIGISAKEAYQKFAALETKPKTNNTLKVFMALNKGTDFSAMLINHLELPILRDYPKIKEIKEFLVESGCKNALMSGSGSCVFGILPMNADNFEIPKLDDCTHFMVKSVRHGVKVAD